MRGLKYCRKVLAHLGVCSDVSGFLKKFVRQQEPEDWYWGLHREILSSLACGPAGGSDAILCGSWLAEDRICPGAASVRLPSQLVSGRCCTATCSSDTGTREATMKSWYGIWPAWRESNARSAPGDQPRTAWVCPLPYTIRNLNDRCSPQEISSARRISRVGAFVDCVFSDEYVRPLPYTKQGRKRHCRSTGLLAPLQLAIR